MDDSQYDPFYDSNGCLIRPERPGIVGVPAHIDNRIILGWTGGANSGTELDSSMHVLFPMQAGVLGVVVGFRSERLRDTVPELVEHGLYFQSAAGHDMVQVIECGVIKTALVARQDSDIFEIRRVNGVVTYWIGTTRIYRSTIKSMGVKLVNACLYASGDAVGKEAVPVPILLNTKNSLSIVDFNPLSLMVPDSHNDVGAVAVPSLVGTTWDDGHRTITFDVPLRGVTRPGSVSYSEFYLLVRMDGLTDPSPGYDWGGSEWDATTNIGSRYTSSETWNVDSGGVSIDDVTYQRLNIRSANLNALLALADFDEDTLSVSITIPDVDPSNATAHVTGTIGDAILVLNNHVSGG